MKSVTFLVGDEWVLSDEKIRRISQKIFKDESSRQMNTDTFTAGETPLGEILSRSETAPFLANKRLILVKDIDRFSERDQEKLSAYLKNTLKYSIWILMTNNPKTIRKKSLKGLSDASDVQSVASPKGDGELRHWIIKAVKDQDKSIDLKAVSILIEREGRSITQIIQRLNQLVTYAGERSRITAEDVQQIVGYSAQAKAFGLYEALADARFDEAMRMLNRLDHEGYHPLEVLGALVWQWDRHLKIRTLLDSGVKGQDIARELRIPEYYANRTLQRAKRLSPGRLEKELQILRSCDLNIKNGSLEPKLALETSVLEMASI